MSEGKESNSDYYLDEKGFIVFTESYHLKRGYCCNNNCRHCPWKKGESENENEKKAEEV